ncbi:dna polymerase epsilon p12 subunit (dna polymerase epsilon subunit 4) [Moniliophthora roreri]|uniref:Transcription factor CBF/NF-Y/archaeal histone domain-containing protein n=1 Tax=Moniliophthora roreri TaxID=221103 RepID=A0A0W0FMD4_MONRR|nr:dna polymerase epsilon p12 subunit (dna polymerase epsilon subunit 4) [Moniliophthora roreri]
MASTSRPTPPHISRLSSTTSIPTPEGKGDDDEVDEVFSDEEEQVDELMSESPSEAEDEQEESYKPGEGKRKPGQTLLPQVRIENILQADGVTSNIALSKEGFFVLSIATEEFIRRMVQGGLQEAKRQQRNNITYQDMEMVPAPVPLHTALQLRETYKDAEQGLLNVEPVSAPPQLPTSQSTAIAPKLPINSAPPKPPKKSKSKTNGTDTSSTFNIHTLKVQPPDPNAIRPPELTTSSRTPGAGVLDARPWTHWSDPIIFEAKKRPKTSLAGSIMDSLPPDHPKHPNPPANYFGKRAPLTLEALYNDTTVKTDAPVPAKDTEDSPEKTSGQFTGPASGFLQNGGSSNTGRTIYTQEP